MKGRPLHGGRREEQNQSSTEGAEATVSGNDKALTYSSYITGVGKEQERGLRHTEEGKNNRTQPGSLGRRRR